LAAPDGRRAERLIEARKRSEANLHSGVRRLVEARGLVDEQTIVWTESVLARMSGSMITKRRILTTVRTGGAFDVEALREHARGGRQFGLSSALIVPEMGGEVAELLSEWRPSLRGNTAVGATEAYLLLTIAGAEITSQGDLKIPGLGLVEIKSIASKSSHCHVADGIEETEARLRARRFLLDEGFDFSSLAIKNLETMADTLEADRFGTILRELFKILAHGKMKMTKSIAEAIHAEPDLAMAGFYGPLAGCAFDRCREQRRFDMALFVNREDDRAVFARHGRSLLGSVMAGHLRIVPSALGFKSERASSVGITL
jgi:hypothetical protein